MKGNDLKAYFEVTKPLIRSTWREMPMPIFYPLEKALRGRSVMNETKQWVLDDLGERQ
ncbi:MAG: hypothetical protein ACLR6J_01975 [Parabacteroides merdae]